VAFTVYRGFKQVVDPLAAAVLLIVLSPVFLLVGLGVLINLGRPVLFLQVRPGLHGKSFRLIKFRTMDLSHRDETVRDGDRLGHFGRILRKTSLDEIPSLWNVLIGDMSFVGPRPLLVEYLPLYSDHHRQRHSVKPGLTGLAQVRGRNHLSWSEKLDLDVDYVQNQSLRLDLSILLRTVFSVLAGTGVTSRNGDTMSRLAPGYDSQ
jgi:lipopolysaccharide/colanic/teichoic acid biosynthesis glycosyltransferase